MLGTQPGAGHARLLLRQFDQPPRVRGVRELDGPGGRAPPAPARLEPLAHSLDVQAQPLEHGSRRPLGPEQREHDVLGPDGVVLQAERNRARLVERALRARAQGVGIDPLSGTFRAQSGFASSMSMMGMPSSTA